MLSIHFSSQRLPITHFKGTEKVVQKMPVDFISMAREDCPTLVYSEQWRNSLEIQSF
jgi:hypothetical protein